MSTNKNIKEEVIRYCDLSAPEDERLELLGSLLLQIKGEMEEKEARRVGEFIHNYLNRKKALDHYFFNRTLRKNEEGELSSELQAELEWVKVFT